MLEPLVGHLLRVSFGQFLAMYWLLIIMNAVVGMTTTLVCVSTPVPPLAAPSLGSVQSLSTAIRAVPWLRWRWVRIQQMRAMGLDCVAHFCVDVAMHRPLPYMGKQWLCDALCDAVRGYIS